MIASKKTLILSISFLFLSLLYFNISKIKADSGTTVLADKGVSDLIGLAFTNEPAVLLYWSDSTVSSNFKVTGYEVGYSTSPITQSNWDQATKVKGATIIKGETGINDNQVYLNIKNLNLATTYYFTVKAYSASGSYTDLSNVFSVKTTDSVKSWNPSNFNQMTDNSWWNPNPALPPGNTSQTYLGYDPIRDMVMTWAGHLYGGGYPQLDELYTYNIGNLSGENTWKMEDINIADVSDKPMGGCTTSGTYDQGNQVMFKLSQYWTSQYEYFRKANFEGWPWLYDFSKHSWFDMKTFNFSRTSNDAPAATYDSDDQIVLSVDSRHDNPNRTQIYDAYTNKSKVIPMGSWVDLGGTRYDLGLVYDSKRHRFVVPISANVPAFGAKGDIWTRSLKGGTWIKEEGVKNSDIFSDRVPMATDAVYDPIHDKIIAFVGYGLYSGGENGLDAKLLLTYIYDPETKTWSRGNDMLGYSNAHRSMDLNAIFSVKHNAAIVLDEGTYGVGEPYGDTSNVWAYRYSDTIPAQTKPSAPQNAALETTTTSAILKWQASGSSGVTGYNIYRAQADNPWDATYAKITAVSSSATSYTDLSITPGKIYFYYATAINASGESEASFKVRTQPRVIQEGYVAVLSDQQTKVKWTPRDEDTDVAGYNVYRAEVTNIQTYPLNQELNLVNEMSSYSRTTIQSIFALWTYSEALEASYVKINSNLIAANEYTDNIDLTNPGAAYPHKVYAYRIKAVNKFGVESGWSPYWATIPNPPTGLKVSQDTNNFYLSWTAPHNGEGIKGYRIYSTYSLHGMKEITSNLTSGIVQQNSVVIPKTLDLYTWQRFHVTAIDNLDQEGGPSAGAWGNRMYSWFYNQYYQFSLATSFLPDATISQSYNIGLQTVNGTAPYSWQITSGSLPAGLSLNSSTGLISGTPANIGDYTFTIKVTDSSNPAKEATKKFTFKVNNILTKTYGNSDFANLVTDWLLTKSSSADASGDGTVNSKDLGIMMSHWAN